MQGYTFSHNAFTLLHNDRETRKKVHETAKKERLQEHNSFINRDTKFVSQFLISGKDLNVEKISPRILLVESDSEKDRIFRWWNLVWWSLPYEKAYGRQMRYIIWDEYHNAPIGLIGLQSPILSWNVRDKYLGVKSADRDYWINQSMSAQRLGALPPYNYILGGKLVASLMTADKIRQDFTKKYRGVTTLIEKRTLPARLLFITTTGAYGKSSVYTRLKFGDDQIASFIGYSQGNGSFHIPNLLYEELIKYLKVNKYDARRSFGSGPSRKLKLIDTALQSLGIMNGSLHGVKRAVYLFPFVNNLKDVVQKNARPKWTKRTVDDLTDYWKSRWALPRIENRTEYKQFDKENFIEMTLASINKNT